MWQEGCPDRGTRARERNRSSSSSPEARARSVPGALTRTGSSDRRHRSVRSPLPSSWAPRGDPDPGFRAILNLWVISSRTLAVVPVPGRRGRRGLLYVDLRLRHGHRRRVVIRRRIVVGRRIPVVRVRRTPPEPGSDTDADENPTASVTPGVARCGRKQQHSDEEPNDQQPYQRWPFHSRPPNQRSPHIQRTTILASSLLLQSVCHAGDSWHTPCTISRTQLKPKGDAIHVPPPGRQGQVVELLVAGRWSDEVGGDTTMMNAQCRAPTPPNPAPDPPFPIPPTPEPSPTPEPRPMPPV